MKFILLDAVLTEINRLIAELVEKGEDTMFEQGRISAFEDAKLFLDTLEVKEVDLREEIDVYFQKNKNGYNNLLICKKEDFSVIAKHFFELGIKVAQKEEKV